VHDHRTGGFKGPEVLGVTVKRQRLKNCSSLEYLYFPTEFFVTFHTSVALKHINYRCSSVVAKLVTMRRVRKYFALWGFSHFITYVR